MAALASDLLRHFRLLWIHLAEFNETWQEARSQCPLPNLFFFRLIGKTRWQPLPLIGCDIFDFFLWKCWTEFNETWQEARSQCSYQVCVFRPIGKKRWPPWRLIGWNIFDISETADQNSKKPNRNQNLNVFHQVRVFQADEKIRIATLANLSKRWHIVQVHDMWPFGPLVILLV